MLESVIGNYIDTLSEREFDAPFIALLRLLGFQDIHFLHGQFEFGKDFIAKKTENGVTQQYVFQTKAGDINLSIWQQIRGQLDLLRTNLLSHPNFDATVPREARLVCTGRLVGAAPLAAQDYVAQLKSRNETGLTIWDREFLIETIIQSPAIALTGGETSRWMSFVSIAEAGELTDREIEALDRAKTKLPALMVQYGVLAHALFSSSRLDLACYACLCLIRSAWAVGHGIDPPDKLSLSVANTARQLFKFYAKQLAELCAAQPKDEKDFLISQNEPAMMVTYRVRCTKSVEILGLATLLAIEEHTEDISELLKITAEFISQHPGACQPISDRWAISLVPPLVSLLIAKSDTDARAAVRKAIKWVGDRYENDNLGLAPYDSTPNLELEHLLGSAFEHVAVSRNTSSYLATILLDLTSIGGLNEEYELAHNDFKAVGALPWIKEVDDTVDQYWYSAGKTRVEPNMTFIPNLQPGDWHSSHYHSRLPESRYLERIGRRWDQLAVAAVLRDRHFVEVIERFVAEGPTL